MNRTKLFVSYSHRDRECLEKLKSHLSPLIRRGLVHVWSDARIGVGSRWQDEIEAALRESDSAVLLVSPDFLASDFIWNEELPKLLAHQKEGMQILPLIARPCAWRIVPELAALLARPTDGRALSVCSDAEIDLALTEFVYELADRLKQLPPQVARERELLRAATETRADTHSSSTPNGSRQTTYTPEAPIEQGKVWVGMYHPTERVLELAILELAGERLVGEIKYDDGSVTEVEGKWQVPPVPFVHAQLRALANGMQKIAGTLTLRELRLTISGSRPPQLGGEYHALVTEVLIIGIWLSHGCVQGNFELQPKQK